MTATLTPATKTIACGNRDGLTAHTHNSVAQVRLCYARRYRMAATPAPAFAPTVPASVPAPATGNIWVNIREAAALVPSVEGFTSTHFAVEHKGVLKFYRLDRPVKGKWRGYTFLKVQASDDYWPVRNPETMLDVLEALTADLEGALAAYGKEIKKCGICHRTLTVLESRERGIGPVCAGRMGL